MILGQLRIWARQAKNAPLVKHLPFDAFSFLNMSSLVLPRPREKIIWVPESEILTLNSIWTLKIASTYFKFQGEHFLPAAQSEMSFPLFSILNFILHPLAISLSQSWPGAQGNASFMASYVTSHWKSQVLQRSKGFQNGPQFCVSMS